MTTSPLAGTDLPTNSQPRSQRAAKRAAALHKVAKEIHQRYEVLAQLPLSEKEGHARALCPLYDEAKLRERLAALQGLPGDNQEALRKALRKLQVRGPLRTVAQAPQPQVLEDLVSGYPNFAEVTRWVQEQLTLCRLSTDQTLQLPPVLLDGPPGIGKTDYSQRLAQRLGVAFERIDLSSARSSHQLVGLDAGYSSSHPGRIWDSLQNDSLSVIWLLDEIDKIPNEGTDSGGQYLLGLLEPHTAVQFTDNWSGLPLNASSLIYIATSNERDKIDAPLLSRFTVFDVAAPTTAQARQIVKNIYQGYQQNEPWGHAFEPTLAEKVVDTFQNCAPRDIRRLLRSAFARAASAGRRHIEASDISKPSRQHHRHIGFV